MKKFLRSAFLILAICFRESSVAFGDVSGNRERCAVELVDKETVAAGKLFRGCADCISEVDRLLVDEEFLELESHAAAPEEESRAVDRVEKRKSID